MNIRDFFGLKTKEGYYSVEYLESLVGKNVKISAGNVPASLAGEMYIGDLTTYNGKCSIDSVMHGTEIYFTTESGEQRKVNIIDISKISYFGNTVKIIVISVLIAVAIYLVVKHKKQ